MTRTKSASRHGIFRAAAATILIGTCAPLCTADDNLIAPPPGFELGPMFVTPSLATGLFANSNPFNRSSDSIAPGEKTGDVIAMLNPALAATVPFRNSWFRAGYNGIFRNYGNANTASNNAQNVTGELALHFASFDQLSFGYNRERGATDTIRFDGGEAVYDGTPYNFVTYEIAAQRDVPGHFGYAADVRFNKLRFDSTQYSFFEYDGWEGAFEARSAFSPTKWAVFGGGFRRYDHRLATDPTHIYRQEIADAVQAGVQGVGAHEQRWRVVLRYDWATYPGGTGSNFSGLGGEALLVLAPGPSSSVTLYASRRTWASFYQENNYYVANVLGTRAEKRFPSGSAIGLDVSGDFTQYPDEVIDPVNHVPLKREDVGARGEFYANFVFRSAYALRVSLQHQGRRSNAGGVDYRGDALGVSFVLGWR